ncbi:signal peptide peptidase SppA [Turneriella parva]|uniref:Signal peptide peptidase A n=1 Tax=Turneriella parva (strain ATCC BAA-1111 / DSM 21527 / NCTC 11395 / H) TaxID=869212 RepID=I4BBY1_TURPD|nr:signal peptide peptidase SppA [Turneriella parva]AFM14788.1 signal peptide peptidase A [Turneriella parva DSM 21527]
MTRWLSLLFNTFTSRALLAIACLFISQSAFAQTAPVQSDALQTNRMIDTPNLPQKSVATSDDTTSLYFNPAGLGYHALQLGYFYGRNQQNRLDDHMLFLNLLGIAFSTQWRLGDTNDYARRYTLGMGIINTASFSLGTSYSWYSSSFGYLDRYNQWDIGAIFRPWRRLSIGAVGRALNKPLFQGQIFETNWDLGVGIRPLPGKYVENLTLSADFNVTPSSTWSTVRPKFIAEASLWPGNTLYAGYAENTGAFFGLRFAQYISQLSLQASTPSDAGAFLGGGILIGRERYATGITALGRYLEIRLDDPVPERKQEGFFFLSENFTFLELIRTVEAAKKDAQIRGILITGRDFHGGWGQAEELRAALVSFQQKKPVYAYLENAGNKEYYIASMADRIFMPQSAMLDVSGLKAEAYFVKDLLNKVGVKADFIALGDYKSAPDRMTRSEPTKFDREQLEGILKSGVGEMKAAILAGRLRVKDVNLDGIMDKGFYSATRAQEVGLIDETAYMTDVENQLTAQGISAMPWRIPAAEYAKTRFYDDTWGTKPAIAVVVLSGEIMSGTSRSEGLFNGGTVGSDTILELMDHIKDDHNIKGMVLRIDSPGGSSLASDIMWNKIREVKKIRGNDFPIVVSIGNVAASGGYYLAVGGDEILASNNSITGSIGIFTGKFNIKGLYDWLGVRKYTFKTHKNAALYTESDSFSDEERLLIREHLTEFYDLFLKRVGDNRGQSAEAIKPLAGGRVYSGKDAIAKKLVDKQGGLLLALQIVREKADIDDSYYNLQVYPSEAQNLLSLGDPRKLMLPGLIREAARLVGKTESIKDEKMLFLMPYEIEIR